MISGNFWRAGRMSSLRSTAWLRLFNRWRIVLAAYAVTLVAGILFLCMSNGGDLFLYTRYANTAREHGLSGLYAQETVEYPPLAAAFIVGVDRFGTMLPTDNPLIHLKIYQAPSQLQEYKLAHRCTMLVIFLVTVWLVRRLCSTAFPAESEWERFQRLLLFLGGSLLSGYVLLDRLDLALAALMAASLWLLIRGRSFLSLVLLAAAIAFKLVPVVLVPVWLLGTLPATGLQLRQLRTALGRLALLAGGVAVFCLPMYWIAGLRSFEFLSYHRARGIEYESSYAAILFALKPFGYPTYLRAAFGSADVESPFATAMLRWAPALVAWSGLAVFILCLLAVRKNETTKSGQTFGQKHPQLLATATLLTMLLLVLFNKVFSPQYVVWVLPLLPLVPLKTKARLGFWVCALGFCGITALIYPLWWKDMLGTELPGQPGCTAGPGVLGTALMLTRMLLLVTMIGLVCQWIRDRIRQDRIEKVHSERRAESVLARLLARGVTWLNTVRKSLANRS
jgi:hypothetical protein